MGSTFIGFQQRGFEGADAAMEVLLALIVKEIDKLAHVPPWLRELRDDWEVRATVGFDFGVIPALDKYVTDEERRKIIIDLSRRALEKLESYGKMIPRDELNALKTGGPDSYFPNDVPAAVFVRTARYFIKLLEGTLDSSENDARFEPG